MNPISGWPVQERPRERLLHQGVRSLSDAELVAILLGHGKKGVSALELGRELLAQCGGLCGLGRMSGDTLARWSGIGPAKSARLIAACELGRRREKAASPARTLIRDPADAARLAAASLRDQDQECFWVLYLDTKHRLLREEIISQGGLDAALAHPREIFRNAVGLRAAAVIVAHNHPSGDPTPSVQDLRLTEQLLQAGMTLGIPLLDHLIVGRGHFTSLADSGYIPKNGGKISGQNQP